ncbi:MAG TPA: C-type lectin domain-containing protein [Candidatus Nanopelagicales bacterium]|nr:C-type lectin domain-containing protein [Candidatus Nanopelagicales bacterium]
MHLARLLRAFALPLCALSLALVPAVACTGDEPAPAGSEVDATNVRVTADDLADLAPGETLQIDLSATDVRYFFYFDRPLDYSRISLVAADGPAVPMSDAMAALLASPYSPELATDMSFVLSARPENFAKLTPEDIAKLRAEGTLMKEEVPGGPAAQPQAEDDCITQILYHTIWVNGQEVICEIKILICDGVPACSELMTYNGHDYLFCTNQESWSAASDYCASYNMKLASINSPTEESWMYAMANILSTQKWWIGLNDRAAEGAHVWENGDAVTYSNWHPGEPNNAGDEDCGQLNRYHPGKGWNDEPCSLHLRFICESQ